jgi:colicin import membrane protein
MADAIRIAVHAASPEEADALFAAVAERAERKRAISMRRADRGEADVSLYAMAPGTAPPEREIAADKTALKFLLASAAEAEAFGKLAGVVVLPLEEGADLRLQARAVVRELKDKVAAPASIAERPVDRAAKKSAKRAAKEAKRIEKKGETSAPAAPAPAAAPAVEAAVDRAAKKEAKRSARQDKRAGHKDGNAAKKARRSASQAQLDAHKADKKENRRAAKTPKRSEKKIVPAATVDAAAPLKDRSEKKAAKRSAKQQKRSEKKTEKTSAAPEAAAVAPERAEKKAAKQAAKRGAAPEDKQAKRAAKKAARAEGAGAAADSAPAKDRTEKKAAKRAAKEAERGAEPGDKQAKRAAKKAARAEGSAVAAAPVPGRAEKKAAKQAAKHAKRSGEPEDKQAKRAAKKAARAEGAAAVADAAPAKDRSETKAAKRAAKEARETEDRAAKKEAKKKAHKDKARADKAARKGAKGDDEPLETAYRHRLSGFSAPASAALSTALQAVFQKAGASLALLDDPEEKADFTLYACDDPASAPDEIRARASAIVDANHRLAIFLERGTPGSGDINRAVAALAAETGGALVEVSRLLARHGVESGSAESYVLIANAVLGLCAGGRVPKHGAGRIAAPVPPDLAEAREAAASPASFFEQGWSDSAPPKLIRAGARTEEVEAFLDSKLLLPSEEVRDFTLPIDWDMALPDRRSRLFLLGLDFLHAPLMYWFGKANGQKGDQYASTTAALKKRGAVPSQLLQRAGEIIVDFARKHPLEAMSDAWDGKTVTRRAPVLAAFALCCRAAVRRKIKFDEKAATQVLLSLFDAIELLRADDFYEPGSLRGVRQDCLLVGLGLALRKTAYGERVIADALARLKKLQLDVGLTSEGVWREGGFGAHCQVLSEISTVLADMGQSGAETVAVVAAEAKKMTVFVEALVKNNGYPLPIDITKPRSYAETLSGARRALAGVGMASAKAASGDKSALKPRMMETYVFRDAQYFVSVSSQRVSVEGSQVVLHADRAAPMNDDPGGLSLAFAFGPRDLVVRRLPTEKLKSKGSRGTLYDPAMRNGYRIDGEGYVEADALGARGARIVRSWRGPGWAAARCTDDLYAKGTLARTVVHLKAQHALIAIDEIASLSGEAAFEQAWHMASDLERPIEGGPLRFGNLAAAFDRGEVALHGETPGVSRRIRLAKGVLATVFQWTEDPAALPRVLVPEEGEAWTVETAGAGFAAKLQYRGGDLLIALESEAPV